MMRAATLLVLASACAGSSSAGRDTTLSNEGPAAVSDTRILATLHNSGWTEKETVIAPDSASFAQGWTRVHATMSPAPPLPAVDFRNELVAIVGGGTRATGGYVMQLGPVRTSGDTLLVEVVLQTPGPQCGATAALTEPVIVLAMRRTAAPPRITLTERPGPSC